MCPPMLICVPDMNSASLDVAYLCTAQPEHMYWKEWLVLQCIRAEVLTSKPLSILGMTFRRSSLRNENLHNVCLFGDDM